MFKKDDSLLFRNNPSPLYVFDVESHDIKGVNKAASKLYGYSEEEFQSLSLEDLHPDNEKTIPIRNKIVQSAFSGNVGVRKHKKKNGEIFLVDLTVETLKYEGRTLKLVHAGSANRSDLTEENLKNAIHVYSSSTVKSNQKELILSAIQNLPGLFCIINEKREYVMWNKNFANVLGYSNQQIKKMHHLDFFREEDREFIQSKIEEVMHNESVFFEADILHKKGHPISHHINGQKLVLDENLYVLFSAVNITDHKEKEKQVKDTLHQKLVLLQEIHHRVKNNLAVITSLLYMQSLYTDHEDARKVLSESQLRIKTMALIHEQLYQSDSLTKIDYKLYLEKLTKSIKDIFDYNNIINLKLECESFEISLNQAVPCSLLINEVMTNAYKYAFTETGRGNILIKVSTEGDRVTAVVRDDGKGLPDDFEEKKKKSFGFTIIETLLEQLKADYEVRNKSGVEFVFSFQMKDTAIPDIST